MDNPIFEIKNLCFTANDKKILDNISFCINEGESVTITGPSGSGKSTLLKIIGTVISPTSGEIKYKNACKQYNDCHWISL